MGKFYNFHPDEIKIVDIIALGRSSSVFVQGFFDGHTKIITIPNIELYFYIISQHWLGIDLEQISELLYEQCVKFLFGDSNDVLKKCIPFKYFQIYVVNYLKTFGVSNRTLFVAAHYAVAKVVYPENIENVEYLIYQNHSLEVFSFGSNSVIDQFQKDFPARKIIFTLRDPRATWLSARKCWPATRTPFFASCILNYEYSLLYQKKHKDLVLFVRHEDFHCNFEAELKKIMSFLQIKFEPVLESSSFFKLPYDGRLLNDGSKNHLASNSGVFSNRPDRRYAQAKWKEQLDGSEIKLVECLSRSYIHRFNYPLSYTKKEGRFSFKNIFPISKQHLKNVKEKTLIHKLAFLLIHIPILGELLVFGIFASLYVVGYLIGFVYLKKVTKTI